MINLQVLPNRYDTQANGVLAVIPYFSFQDDAEVVAIPKGRLKSRSCDLEFSDDAP